MATNRFLCRLAAILRKTADLRAQSWRDEVSAAGWVVAPDLAAPCSCCHRRALKPVAPSATNGRAAVHFCPTVTVSAPRCSPLASLLGRTSAHG
jgi:hypothetical protein